MSRPEHDSVVRLLDIQEALDIAGDVDGRLADLERLVACLRRRDQFRADRAGEVVNIVFDNRGMMFHTLTVGGLGLDLRADGGDSISGSVRPEKSGTYSFICAVPGHAEAGMRGTVEVE